MAKKFLTAKVCQRSHPWTERSGYVVVAFTYCNELEQDRHVDHMKSCGWMLWIAGYTDCPWVEFAVIPASCLYRPILNQKLFDKKDSNG